MNRNRAISPRSGFTLVELLIVIIVIAVLAAIAILKFVNSSARSKEASLHADLRSCGTPSNFFITIRERSLRHSTPFPLR